MTTATTQACANIALIKYWGNRDDTLRLAANSSLSMNLGGLETRTSIAFDLSLAADELTLNGRPGPVEALRRMSGFLDLVRGMAGSQLRARVSSENNFPTGAGIASSASAYAALALAASTALGLDLSERDLSRLARRGSGSACRSIPGGFVEWQAGETDADSYAFSIAPPDYWDLVDVIAVVEAGEKATGSSAGHSLAATSILQPARVADAPRRVVLCRQAIVEKDFEKLAEVVELDCNLMHAVMITSTPLLIYWEPGTLELICQVQSWRAAGLPVCYTIDAGPNVHILTLGDSAAVVEELVRNVPAVRTVYVAPPGGPARLVNDGHF
ncbi:MAG TPA: diphosphomevalonate decarboxylase [Anaerolineaceae bacterium]|nr:diphosphomevalonate decarboxylase [Anaerolineaceae bacterium]